MGPFKALSAIFSAVSKVAVVTETMADTVNIWADTAKEASKLTSQQMLDELKYENSIRAEELKKRLSQGK